MGNEYVLKNVVESFGHEDELLVLCDIFNGDKKVGTYETLDWGGSPEFSFVSEDEKDRFNEFTKKLSNDTDWYMRGLVVMHEMVSDYLEEKYGE